MLSMNTRKSGEIWHPGFSPAPRSLRLSHHMALVVRTTAHPSPQPVRAQAKAKVRPKGQGKVPQKGTPCSGFVISRMAARSKRCASRGSWRSVSAGTPANSSTAVHSRSRTGRPALARTTAPRTIPIRPTEILHRHSCCRLLLVTSVIRVQYPSMGHRFPHLCFRMSLLAAYKIHRPRRRLLMLLCFAREGSAPPPLPQAACISPLPSWVLPIVVLLPRF